MTTTSAPRRNTERIFIEVIKAALSNEWRLAGFYVGEPRSVTPVDPSVDRGGVTEPSVWVLERGGERDVPFIDGGGGGAEMRPGLTIWVRGPERDYDTGKNLADDVWRAVDKKPPTADGFYEARCEQSAPIYLGFDDAQKPLWSINVALKRYQPSQW
jgi:hypothetical protein